MDESTTPQPVRIADITKQYGLKYSQIEEWLLQEKLTLVLVGDGLEYQLAPDTHALIPDLINALPENERPRLFRPRAVKQAVAAEWLSLNEGVYVLHMPPYYKIGRSERPAQRIAELVAFLPERPTLFAFIETRISHDIEAYLHIRFDASRRNGEWFVLNDDDTQYLTRLAYHFPRHPMRWVPGAGIRLEGVKRRFDTSNDAIDYLGALPIPNVGK